MALPHPRPGRDSLRDDNEKSPLATFPPGALGPARARVPQQFGCARRGPGGWFLLSKPPPPPPASRVTVPLTSGDFWFIPWHGDFIFITACSAAELE